MLQEKSFGKLNADAGDHDLPKEDYRDCYDMIPVKDGAAFTPRRQFVKGNALIPSAEIGTGAKAIGTYYDEKNNRVIWVNVNDSGKAELFYYYPETDTITKRVASDLFNITKDTNLYSLMVIDHYVIWLDDSGQIMQYDLNHEGANGSLFTGADKVIKLHRPQPFRSPWSVRQTLGSLTVNKITGDSFQFACQYVYTDGARSVVSPLSATNIGDKIQLSYNDPTDNSIRVYIPYYDIDTLDYVDVMYRKNQNDDYYTFRSLRDLEDTLVVSDPAGGGVQTTVWYTDFTGEEASSIVPQEDVIKKYEAIPKQAPDLVFAKGRLFTVRSTANTELGDISGISFTAQAHNDSPIQSDRAMYLMPGTTYVMGLEFFNEDMESTTIVKTANIEVPDILSEYAVERMLNTKRYRAKINISGTPPDNWDRYRILMTKNQKYSEWAQVTLKFLFWSSGGNKHENGENVPSSQEFEDLDTIYDIPKFLNENKVISQIHLQVPVNLPFEITTDHKVRIITDGITGHPASDFIVEQVLGVEGDKIIVGNFGFTNWDFIEASQVTKNKITAQIICEIFKPNEAVESIFYETGLEYRIREAGGTRYFATPEIVFDGDVFEWSGETNWLNREIYRANYPDSLNETIRGFQQAFTTSKNVFIKSPNKDEEAKPIIGPVPVDWGAYPFYTLDYGKRASDRGRSNLEADYLLIHAGYSLAYSRIYKSNTNLNGLNNFDTDGTYDLDLEAGDINKLVLIHENLMIAIHPRSVTSLYLGEAFIKQADAVDVLTKTEGIIGQHRVAQGEYGTINPESVVVADGRVFWWDALRGCIVKYDNNGLDEVSKESMMKTFFEELADTIKPYRDIAQIVGEYHEFHDLIIWTFKPIVAPQGAVEATVFPGLTISYRVGKRSEEVSNRYSGFITKFSFIPERYARIPQTVVSFLDGALYKHDENSNYSTYYGTTYVPYIKTLLNQFPTREKIWENFLVDANVKLFLKLTINNQYTEIKDQDYFQRHSTFYADIMRDMNTPVAIGKNAKITGDTMLGTIAELIITVPSDRANQHTEINEIHVGFRLVSGHFIEEKPEKNPG